MIYLMGPLTSESGWKVLKGEKGTGKRKKCWKEQRESSGFAKYYV